MWTIGMVWTLVGRYVEKGKLPELQPLPLVLFRNLLLSLYAPFYRAILPSTPDRRLVPALGLSYRATLLPQDKMSIEPVKGES